MEPGLNAVLYIGTRGQRPAFGGGGLGAVKEPGTFSEL